MFFFISNINLKKLNDDYHNTNSFRVNTLIIPLEEWNRKNKPTV